MVKPNWVDHTKTRNYIPIISTEYTPPLSHKFQDLEKRYIHEGRVVFSDFEDFRYLESMLGSANLQCLYKINESIVPRFVLEFYSQLRLRHESFTELYIEFVIQHKFFSYSLPEFGRILGIPTSGQCSFTNEWSLDALITTTPTIGKYATVLPPLDEIKTIVLKPRTSTLTRTYQGKKIPLMENQILTNEVDTHLKFIEEVVRENVFCLCGNRSHLPACLCHMLYCIATLTPYNLAFFVMRRMEFITKKKKLNMPYGMLLTRLFNHIMNEFPELQSGKYHVHGRVMFPLTNHIKRKTRKDSGTKRTLLPESSSGDSSSHHIDDDGHVGSSSASASSPILNLIDTLPQIPQNLESQDPSVVALLTQIRDEQRKGLKSIEKILKKKKK